MAEKTRLYALIVGINAYPSSPLSGCVSDAEKMLQYLQEDDQFELIPEKLCNEEATKSAIVRSFKEHLGKAQAGDVVLFYFSGHGAQEWADTAVWRSEYDEKLETLACFDPYGKAALLADKELRYLIRQVANGTPQQPKAEPPHIVVLADCCHSGDNTRSLGGEIREKRFNAVFPKREWKDFCFAAALPRERFLQEAIADLLPEGAHVQLAAARDDQPAIESGNEGVFTKNLLAVLRRSKGKIDYSSLHNLLSNYIRPKQHPQLYVQGGNPELARTGFLGRPLDYDGKLLAQVQYSKTEGWILDMGAMQGIGLETEVEVFLADKPLQPGINQVHADFAQLEFNFDDRSSLDKMQPYEAAVLAYSAYPVHVYLHDAEGDADFAQQIKNAISENSKRIQWMESEDLADYTLHIRFGQLYLTQPFDSYRPLVAPISIDASQAEQTITHYLEHIAKWEYLRQFYNLNTRIFKEQPVEVRIEYLKDGDYAELAYLEKGSIIDHLEYSSRVNQYYAKMRIALTNKLDIPLYCCPLWLTMAFDSGAYLTEKPVIVLPAGATVWLYEHKNKVINILMEPMIQDYNWPFDTCHLKLVISTDDNINPYNLILEGLPEPPNTAGKGKGTPADDNLLLDQPIDWNTQLITVRFKNPLYNSIQLERLQKMLWNPSDQLDSMIPIGNEAESVSDYFKKLDQFLAENPDAIDDLIGQNPMTPFAAGLYLEPDTLSGQLKIREEIIIGDPQPDGEIVKNKSLFWKYLLKTANTYGRTVRRRDFERRLKKYPNRILMVSEGDSWFQHPAIMEIIDHLSLFYNIYSRDAAGDEMRGYIMTGEFINALDDMSQRMGADKVKFFLISGGGNDVLGDQFAGFLNPFAEVSDCEEGQDCRRFLNQKFFEEMDSVMDLYEMVFGRVANEFPQVKIITHGYDYPIPKGPEEKGMAWLGKSMTEQGILRPNDRQGIINYLIDYFNERLMALVQKYPNVHHLDLRNTVHSYQWNDEIHPNGEGYQNIAMKYVKLIDQLSKV
ncbi:MAG TPA: caspase family protein [Saprospiraceae bacterium]|nr:caspase family protein [Saprospiraceae bacterium]HMQ82687.1 caspase family protein [Saprospiraceae bacterium]